MNCEKRLKRKIYIAAREVMEEQGEEILKEKKMPMWKKKGKRHKWFKAGEREIIVFPKLRIYGFEDMELL